MTNEQIDIFLQMHGSIVQTFAAMILINFDLAVLFLYVLFVEFDHVLLVTFSKKRLQHENKQNRPKETTLHYHTGKCIRRFGGIYAYCRYFIGRRW